MVRVHLSPVCGGVAQLGEHLPCKQGVKSSNLSISIHLEKDVKEFTGDDSTFEESVLQ